MYSMYLHNALLLTMAKVPNFQLRDWESRFNTLLRMRIFPPGQLQVRQMLIKILRDYSVQCKVEVMDYAALQLPCSYEAIHRFSWHQICAKCVFPEPCGPRIRPLPSPLVTKAYAA